MAKEEKFSWDDYAPVPQKYSTLHNIGAGFADPYIELANRAARGLGAGEHQISHIPYNPGVASGIGEIGSYVVPIGGEDLAITKGLGEIAKLAPKAMAALKGSRAARIIGRLGRGAAEGSTTGVAMRPENQSAQSAAITGGLGGAAGEAVGGILTHTVNPLFRTARFQNFKNAFLKGKLNKLPQHAQRDAVEDVIDRYGDARQESNKLYRPIWDKLKAANQSMEALHLPNTLREMETDGKNALITPEDLPIKKDGTFDPEEFHYLKAEIGQAANKSKKIGDIASMREARQGFRYANSMKEDLEDFLDTRGLKENYKNAQENWKKTMLPYVESKIFKKIYPHLVRTTESGHGIEGKEMGEGALKELKDTAPISKIANTLLPAGNEATDNVLNDFTHLLGGDRQSAIQHARNLFFSKHFDGKNFDMKGLARDLNKLKGENREALISKHEKSHLEEMERLGKLELTPGRKHLLSMLVSGLVGHHLWGGGEAAVGGGIAGLVGEPYLEQAAASLLGSAPMRALERGLRKKPPLKLAGAPLGIALGRPRTNYEVNES